MSHLIFILLAVGFPLWDRWEVRQLRSTTDGAAKMACYVRVIVTLWASSLLITIISPIHTWWRTPTTLAALLKPPTPSEMHFLACVLAAGLALPVLLALIHKKTRDAVLAPLQAVDFLLPQTALEQFTFGIVSITAGVCEEVIYRGFVIHYLQSPPIGLTAAWALGLSAILFGTAHAGQGVKGILATAIVGVALGMLYAISGDLILPIVVHALVDLRALALSRLRPAPAAAKLTAQ